MTSTLVRVFYFKCKGCGHNYAPSAVKGGLCPECRRLYRWAWKKWPALEWGQPSPYYGKRCRLLATGKRNTVLIEFENGDTFITLRYGLRRVYK